MAKVKYKTPTSGMNRMITIPDPDSRPSIGMTEIKGEIYYFSPDVIIPYKNQARKDFDEESLNELALSIKSHGVIQPLQIIKSEDVEGKFEVVSGERRLRAAQMIGLEKLPCMILDKDRDHDEIALIENIQRKDLHPIELADAIALLVDKKGGVSQVELARKIGVSKQQIGHFIIISRLPNDIKNHLLKDEKIGVKQIRDLAYLKSEEELRNRVFKRTPLSSKYLSVIRISANGSDVKIEMNRCEKLSSQEKSNLREKLVLILSSLN